MSHHPSRRPLPLIAVHAGTAANAEKRVTELLGAAGASPGEVHTLIAAIRAGAVEGAEGEVIALDTQAPADASDQVQEGWLRAVETISERLAHIADRTVQQARTAAAAVETRPVTFESEPNSLPTPVDQVGEGQVQHVLAAAERIFVSLTGYTGFDRDLSQEILAGVLKSVSAEQQQDYVRQLEAFAEAGRERLVRSQSGCGPAGTRGRWGSRSALPTSSR